MCAPSDACLQGDLHGSAFETRQGQDRQLAVAMRLTRFTAGSGSSGQFLDEQQQVLEACWSEFHACGSSAGRRLPRSRAPRRSAWAPPSRPISGPVQTNVRCVGVVNQL